MISCGCMEHPHVDYMLGLHVMPSRESGTVEYRHGMLNASSDHIKITVHGKSCHGAYPEQGIDAIVIASHLVCSLQTLVSRSISPLQSAVLSFGNACRLQTTVLYFRHDQNHEGESCAPDVPFASRAKERVVGSPIPPSNS